MLAVSTLKFIGMENFVLPLNRVVLATNITVGAVRKAVVHDLLSVIRKEED